MIGMNVWWVYLAPQNIPSAIVLLNIVLAVAKKHTIP